MYLHVRVVCLSVTGFDKFLPVISRVILTLSSVKKKSLNIIVEVYLRADIPLPKLLVSFSSLGIELLPTYSPVEQFPLKILNPSPNLREMWTPGFSQ